MSTSHTSIGVPDGTELPCNCFAQTTLAVDIPLLSKEGAARKRGVVSKVAQPPYRCCAASFFIRSAARASLRWLRSFSNHPDRCANFPSLERRGIFTSAISCAKPLFRLIASTGDFQRTHRRSRCGGIRPIQRNQFVLVPYHEPFPLPQRIGR